MLLPNAPAGGSARHLVITHAAAIINAEAPPELQPGEQQLFSFYKPGLEAGLHKVAVTQDIDANGQPMKLESPQQFNVIAPRFTLPAGSVHSTYPPPGRADHVETLPHIVLMDPHLPWERTASKQSPLPEDHKRNKVPWLAVVVFTQEELQLGAPLLDQNTGIFRETQDMKWPVVQDTTLAVNMTIGNIWKTKNTTTPIAGDKDDQELVKAQTDVIFLKSELFTSLVTTYNDDGEPVKNQTVPDVSRYKYLSHVRNVNTTGMAEACLTDGLFSIVVSHRVGPLAITQPTPVVVHLISIEGVENMTLPLSAENQFVALSSLYSWTYTCLPPSSLNVLEMFRGLGSTLDVLRAPKSIIQGLQSRGAEAQRVAERLTDGYSLVKYYTQSGEETVALTRSPFTPTTIPHPLADWRLLSTFGTDLQIFDQVAGVMDITYSSAWQLGKTLALADQTFGAALARVRTLVYDRGMNNAKAEALTKVGAYQTRAQTLKSLSRSIQTLNGLPQGDLLKGEGKMLDRWRRPAVVPLDLSFGSPVVDFQKHAGGVMQTLSRTADGEGKEFYNEINAPYSTDWMIVFKWVLDKMNLVGVPAHYLITDPSHLPRESLRFFHIDANWVDALVDGALSVANHFDRHEDFIRDSIKVDINKYLDTVDPALGYAPQIPTYGFLLRSDLCSQFPDLVVSAPMLPEKLGAPLLRHENIDDGVMLCLFDRVPSGPEFQSLTFTQPPHQQCFAAGGILDEAQLITQYKTVYTHRNPDSPEKVEITPKTSLKTDKNPVFLWGGPKAEIRTLRFPAWAQDVFDAIDHGMNTAEAGSFKDSYPGAALVGIQLGTPIYSLTIKLEERAELESLLTAESLQPGPRSLKMMQAKPKDAVPAAAATVLAPTPPKAVPRPMASLPPFGKRTRPTPLSVAVPPPHFRFLRTSAPILRSHTSVPALESQLSAIMPTLQSPAAKLSALPLSGDPSGPVTFVCKIYPIDSTIDNEVPTGGETAIGQDLVFSIVLVSGWDNDVALNELTVHIPLGPDGVKPPNMLQSYNGPGATMLSNLRFNVLLQFTEKELQLRLRPRSTKGGVQVEDIKEMSFLLSMVKVHQNPKTQVVKIKFQEFYHASSPTTEFFVNLVPEEPKKE